MTPEDLRRRLNYLLYAERVTRILARRSGIVEGYRWRAPWPGARDQTRLTSHRAPPLPFYSQPAVPGQCRVCGQPIYGGGSFRSFAGPVSKRLTWHSVCTATYFLMTKPTDQSQALILRQAGRCAITAEPIGPPAREWCSSVDIDHEVPLFRVARKHAEEPWFDLIRFWMTGNLRAITPEAHKTKGAEEARERAGYRAPSPQQEALL